MFVTLFFVKVTILPELLEMAVNLKNNCCNIWLVRLVIPCLTPISLILETETLKRSPSHLRTLQIASEFACVDFCLDTNVNMPCILNAVKTDLKRIAIPTKWWIYRNMIPATNIKQNST